MHSTLAFKFNQFLKGLLIPFQAFKLIFDKTELLGVSLAPIISAVVVFSILIYALMAGVWTLVHSIYLSSVSNYTGLIFILVSALALSALSFFATSLLTFLMSLLASPFNDILAEKTEIALGIKNVPHWSTGRFFRVLWIDLRKSVVTLFSAIIFSLGMLLPVANIIFFIGLALLNTFTFITYPQSRREQGILQSLKWIGNHFYLSLGFGTITLILFTIPVIDFFALPISVVGGTLLFLDGEQKRN